MADREARRSAEQLGDEIAHAHFLGRAAAVIRTAAAANATRPSMAEGAVRVDFLRGLARIGRLATGARGRPPVQPGVVPMLVLPLALAALVLVVVKVFGVRPDLPGCVLTGVGGLKFVGGAALVVAGARLAAAQAPPRASRRARSPMRCGARRTTC